MHCFLHVPPFLFLRYNWQDWPLITIVPGSTPSGCGGFLPLRGPSLCFLHCKSWCNSLQVSALKNARSGPPCSLATAGLLLLPVNALLFVLLLQSHPPSLFLSRTMFLSVSLPPQAHTSFLSLSLVLTLHAFPASVPGQEWGQSIEQGMGITVPWIIQSGWWEWKTSAHHLGVVRFQM